MMKDCCGWNLNFFGSVLLAGCCLSTAFAESWQVPNDSEAIAPARPRIAGMIRSSSDLLRPKTTQPTPQPVATLNENKYWAFPSENISGPVLQLPVVLRLPPISPTESQPATNDVQENKPIASLLPPQTLAAAQPTTEEASVDLESPEPKMVVNDTDTTLSAEEQEIVDAIILDSRAVTTGVLTNDRVNQLAQTKIRQAYAMAGRGAYYAARQELIEVLRMISHSKDAAIGKPKQTLDLAAGLLALDEAEDFAPRDTRLEADLAINVICASHQTPVAQQLRSSDILPRQMMNCYYRYAQLKLAAAVKDEPAGSMALHALGKLTSRLQQVEPEKHRWGHRRAVAFQQASLLAHHQNHLAAHELAVLLADSGHYTEAEQLLKQVTAREPNAVVYRNLARVQESLGQSQQAAMSRDLAQRLTRQGSGGTSNVQWVSPQDFSRSSSNSTRFASVMPHPPTPHQPVSSSATPPQYIPAPASNWR